MLVKGPSCKPFTEGCVHALGVVLCAGVRHHKRILRMPKRVHAEKKCSGFPACACAPKKKSTIVQRRTWKFQSSIIFIITWLNLTKSYAIQMAECTIYLHKKSAISYLQFSKKYLMKLILVTMSQKTNTHFFWLTQPKFTKSYAFQMAECLIYPREKSAKSYAQFYKTHLMTLILFTRSQKNQHSFLLIYSTKIYKKIRISNDRITHSFPWKKRSKLCAILLKNICWHYSFAQDPEK